ncbi:D-tagatose-bisphosphate aldolase, class II, non-catalytic subunit [Vibrio aestuarianus]|uniref:D-tagatose-bisphosphate aldolase, class II, non-catalytic subunit n=1 Tax=Vibrio TaxID=662 RepID=UPI001482B4FB|nr:MULTISPECIES: D-tagatose-bisphosphate aldolase, class II, non-catalytic subunit [Vibrio]MBD1566656.1 D-tagatose-bisphosphate aldolase, class II, non-catalytic subunit [Vibrio sp. S12_S33]MDE1252195.1 D-tagatose-bisphosphate aldolase, class II, non-catalytic subunit [Vibrio aestuarianus]NGZ14487.1 D-tagatose-bisphosphate aldolase, class II, non-catalytic subunit [Vibrio aestuarianus]NKZ50635.1 D-tagatose-bisphosphate aldolase, class II, non-catalytic subunit [Vibrio aestuarianus]NNN49617.1 D
MKALLSLIEQHKQGQATGIYSVCSAHPLVLEAAIKQAAQDQQLVLIEATSNQVNQFGGYTGMTPQDFSNHVLALAERLDFPIEKVVLGGDHLGPNCWQNLSASQAMEYSAQMIHDYVCAGFKKIHLDCSMPCADDSLPLSEEVMASRAAQLCLVAEKAWKSVGGEAPLYVVGTEVPTPGGALESLQDECIEVTKPEQALATLDAHHQAFSDVGLGYVWPRVIGLVVQPGVEFDHHMVHHYQSDEAQLLSKMIDTQPHLVFEAHSTDYQNPPAYHQLVRDHFAILKVGPALTFALREAFYGLERAEKEWLGTHHSSHLRDTIEQVMHEQPNYWRSHYSSKGHQQYLDCSYSLSDRIRYYWTHPEVKAAQQALFDNLTVHPLPVTILSQYLPNQAKAISQNQIQNQPAEIVMHKIMEVTQVYSEACYANIVASKETIK